MNILQVFKILANLILLFSKSGAHQGKAVLEFQHGVALDGLTALAVKPRGVKVHLHLVHQIHVSLTGQLAADYFVQGHTLEDRKCENFFNLLDEITIFAMTIKLMCI